MKLYCLFIFVLLTIVVSFSQAVGSRSSIVSKSSPIRHSTQLPSTWQLTLKDSRYLNQMVQKNAWFNEFRQTSLYASMTLKISPVLSSVADDFGPSVESWKGRLLDYAYDKIMDGMPVMISYYNRPNMLSPVVISLFDLPSANSKVAEGLIKIFRSAEDEEYELKGAVRVKVTPLVIRKQKFAVFLKNKCLVIGRDPELVSLNALECQDLKTPEVDGVFQVRISQQFPALSALREKFLATDDVMQMNLKWNASMYKFEPHEAQVQLKGLSAFQKEKLSASVIKGLPANSFFYVTAILPNLDSADGQGLAKYFSEDKKILFKGKPSSVTLFYTPFIESFEWRIGAGLLLHYPSASARALGDLSQQMMEQKNAQTFVSPVCKDLIALSNKRNMVRQVEDVCRKKQASFADLNVKWGLQLTQKDISTAFYFSSGKLMSHYMQAGWQKNKNQMNELPSEIKKSKKLVESLPEYLFSGTTDKKNLLLMKSTL